MSKGRPTIALRLDKWQITGLKLLAKRGNTTVSDLIREMIDTILYVNGITATPEQPISGQISAEDLTEA